MSSKPKNQNLVGFVPMRKAMPGAFAHGKIPTDPEVNRDKKLPRGVWEFWKYVVDSTDTLIIKNVHPDSAYGAKCGGLLKLAFKRFPLERLLVLGKYYATNWLALQKAYNWKAVPSPVQFVQYLDRIDFCETNGIPLSSSDRVTGKEDYDADVLEAFKEMSKSTGDDDAGQD